MSNKYKFFIYRMGLVGFTNLILSFSGIILLPILTKNMPIQDYGIWSQINVTIGLVPAIATLGLPFTLVRYLPAKKEIADISEIFYSVVVIELFISLIFSLLIYEFSKTIASNLFDNNIYVVEIVSAIVFFECSNTLIINYFRATQQIKKYSIIDFTQNSLSILLVGIFVLQGYGIIGASIGFLIKGLSTFLILNYTIISEIGLKIPAFKNIKEYLNFGLPTVPGYISSWIVNSSDCYVIGLFLGTSFVGYYSPGYSLGNMIRMFVTPFYFMLPMVLSKQYDEKNVEEVKKTLSYCFKYFLAVGIPATFGISMFSKTLLNILTTEEIALNSYIITPFIALSTLLYGVITIMNQILIIKKKTKIAAVIWIKSALLNLGLNFIIIPFMGITGAAITTLISFAYALILISKHCNKLLTFEIEISFIFKSIFASIIMCLIITYISPTKLLGVVITIGICAISYFSILLFLSGFEKKEILFFKEMVKFRD